MKFTAEMFKELARTATDPEAAEKAAAILNGKMDPATVPGTAEWIRACYHLPRQEDLILHAVNCVLDLYGVEPLRVEGAWVDNYHGEIVASYANTGDPYIPTVLLDSESGEFLFVSYGDYLENLQDAE